MPELKNSIQDQYGNTAGLVISGNSKLMFEYYNQDYCQTDKIHIASVTKSIVSVLLGIAIRKGQIKSIDQKVLEFFPEYQIKRGEHTVQKISIKNLMTMTAPYKFNSEPHTKVYSSDDWTRASLDLLGGKDNIGDSKYTTVGLQVLCMKR